METFISVLGVVVAICAALFGNKKTKESKAVARASAKSTVQALQRKQKQNLQERKAQINLNHSVSHPEFNDPDKKSKQAAKQAAKQSAGSNMQARSNLTAKSNAAGKKAERRVPAKQQGETFNQIQENRKQQLREDWQVASDLEIEKTDLMHNVEKLMITGYESDMKFDRDFISEGVEMLNRLSVVENIVHIG